MLGNIGNISGVGSIVAVVGIAGLDKFEQDLSKMAKAVDGQAQFMNRAMTAAAAAGAASFLLSIKAASDFESSFAGVVKTVDGLSDEFGNLNAEGKALAGQFRELALEIPISVNELARIGELGGQLGIPKQELLGFTETIAMLGKTTNLSVEEGSTAIARFINITKNVAPAGMSMSEQASRIGSTIVDLGNKLATTEAEITEFAMRIAGAGGQVGLSQEKIIAFGAALSSAGLNAEAGGTAISRLFIELANSVGTGGKKLAEFARISDMSISQFSALFKKDAAEATLAFLTGMNNMAKSGENIFPVLENLGLSEIRLRDTILRGATARDILNNAINWGSEAYRENNAMALEAQKRFETFESQMQSLKNTFNEAFIQLGQNFLPTLKMIASLAKENSGALTLLISTIGGVTIALGAAALAMKVYKTSVELSAFANRAFASSLGPVGLAITAIGGAYLLLSNYLKQTEKSEEELGRAQAERSRKIKELSERYDSLIKNEGLSLTHQQELWQVTQELKDAYGEAGVKIKEFGKSALDEFNQYQQKIKPRLESELELLRQRQSYYMQESGRDSGAAAFQNTMKYADSEEIKKGYENLRKLRQERGLLTEEEKKATDQSAALAKAEAEKIRQQELAAAAAEALKNRQKELTEWENSVKEHLFETRIEMQRYIDQVTAAPQPIGELVGSTHLLDYTITDARGNVRSLGDEFVAAAFKAGNDLNPVLEEIEIKVKSAKEEMREFSKQLRGVIDITSSLAQAFGGKIGGAFEAISKGVQSAQGGIIGVASWYISTIGEVIKQDKQIEDHRKKMESLNRVWSELGTTSKEVLDIMKEVVTNYQSPYLDQLIADVEYFETLDQLSEEALAVYRNSLESMKLIGGALASDLAMSTALDNMRYLNDEYFRMEEYYGKGSVAKMAPQFFTLLTEAMDGTRKSMYRFNEETQRYELIIDKNSKAYKELGAEMYRMYLIAQENGWLAYGDFSAITRGLSGDLESWRLAFEELYGTVDEATQSLKDFSVEADKAFSTISDQFDNFESSAKEIENLLKRMLYLKIDIDTTDLDESIISSMKSMYEFIGTLDPDSEAWKDADAYFRNLMTLLNQIGYSWADIYKLFGMPLPNINPQIAPEESGKIDPERSAQKQAQESTKVAPPVADIGGEYNRAYWDKVLSGIDEAYYRNYEATQAKLEEAKLDLEKLRNESAAKIAEIDAQYSAKIAERRAERSDVEHELLLLLGERAEIATSIQLQTTELRGNASEILSFLTVMGEKRDLTVIRDIEDAVARITGKTRDFTTGWDDMLTRLSGGQNKEFDQTAEAIRAASSALEQALYYGEDIDETPMEERINSLLFSAQNFANELNPDSQAFKDAQAAIGALMTKFYQAGGTPDKAAAAESAKKWAAEMAAAAEEEAKKIEESGAYNLLKIDLDIAGVKEQISAIDSEIIALFKEWDDEKLEITLEITQAEAQIAKLRSDLKRMREDWYQSKIYLYFESEGIVGSAPEHYPQYRWGGYVEEDSVALLHGAEFVLSPEAVAAIGKDRLERFNASADPSTISRIDRSASASSLAKSQSSGSSKQPISVIVHESSPQTWVEITDKKIHPRVTEKDRKYKAGSNPYAR